MTSPRSSASKPFTPALSGSLFYLVNFLCVGSYLPFINVYFAELGLSGKQIGLISSLGPIMSLLLSTTVASFADRNRRRVRITQGSLVGITIVVFLLRMPTSFANIALLMLFMAIFASPTMAISEGLIARMAQRHHLNYGAMRLWGSLGYAFSALVFGAFWQAFGFKAMFLVGGSLYLPLIWLTGQLEEGPIIPPQERKPFTHLLRDRGLLLLLVATFLAGVSNSVAMTFSGIYAHSLGAGNFLIGAMIAVGALAELPMMFLSDRLSHRIRRTNTVLLAYALMAASYLGYVLTKNPNLLPVLSILKGFGYALWITVTIRMVTERTPEEWASTAQSLLTLCMYGLSQLVAGPLGGWINDAISPAAVFGFGVIALALAALVLWLASRRVDLG